MPAVGGDQSLQITMMEINITKLQSSTSQYLENTTFFLDNFDYSSTSQDYSDFPVLCDKERNRQFRLWFMPLFYSIICLLGVAGNLLVIATVFYFKRLKNMTDVYLLNLSFADLLFALSLPFWAANSMAEWILGLFVCKAMHTIYKVSFYSSMFLLSLISIDRYFAIAKAVSTHGLRSKAVFLSKLSSTASWVMALICSIPEMMYTNINNNTCDPFSTKNDKLRVGFQSSQIVLGFLVPLLIMSFCYTCIIQTLCHARGFERNRAIKVILAIVIVFLVSQMPYNIILFWTTIVTGAGGTENCNYDNGLLFATDITQYVAFLRCCLNPFVYAFIGVKFRHDVLKLLKEIGCMSQERFYRYTCGRRRSSAGLDTETTTSFAPKGVNPTCKELGMD
ncbi:PREDICTED: C-C chemokine receptor type 7 isoform X3 [Poecilia mexicana]|uniref:G-protein coupled receptors family 1 profile domain-containing protein n=1 Tax=Poecilia mexicana TaxID=48701 RepID=A0A3B3WHV2_9TELE|nr:PREDICTED: C-C chemokine receptor type 7 isoform X3 [Poecilia mexicana]